jgi:hypothetical protein
MYLILKPFDSPAACLLSIVSCAPVTTPICRNGQVRKQEMKENFSRDNGNNVCLCDLFGTLQLLILMVAQLFKIMT